MSEPSLSRPSSMALLVLQKHVGPCREWIEDRADNCGADAEYLLWGKLIPAEGLGPRCYHHAAVHVGFDALRARSGWAIVNLRDLAEDVSSAS